MATLLLSPTHCTTTTTEAPFNLVRVMNRDLELARHLPHQARVLLEVASNENGIRATLVKDLLRQRTGIDAANSGDKKWFVSPSNGDRGRGLEGGLNVLTNGLGEPGLRSGLAVSEGVKQAQALLRRVAGRGDVEQVHAVRGEQRRKALCVLNRPRRLVEVLKPLGARDTAGLYVSVKEGLLQNGLTGRREAYLPA